ncbi:MAG: orotidine-5'-phosphate decarboxylase [Bacteroidia bacterium]
MNRKQLIEQIRLKKSFLCVGLDTELSKIPPHLLDEEDPIFSFNKSIIEATSEFAVAYKINLAFYEQYGIIGWQSMEKTLAAIPKNCFTIADAKRGDIGNTSKMYAKAFFETYNYDSITVSPYMGQDSVGPFLEYKDKFTIVLGLTSNAGNADFQMLETEGEKVYESVLKKTATWGTPDNLMFVIGATKAEKFAEIRKILPDHFLLVPGVGAQGGDLKGVATNGLNKDCCLLVNSSRGIIYASNGLDFKEAAREEARKLQQEMKGYLEDSKIL